MTARREIPGDHDVTVSLNPDVERESVGAAQVRMYFPAVSKRGIKTALRVVPSQSKLAIRTLVLVRARHYQLLIRLQNGAKRTRTRIVLTFKVRSHHAARAIGVIKCSVRV